MHKLNTYTFNTSSGSYSIRTLGVFLLTIVIFNTSCLKKEGTISIKNGRGKDVEVPYKISPNIVTQYSKKDFKSIVSQASELAKSRCKYELTYEPMEVNVYGFDTISLIINFSAENGFGVPDMEVAYFDFVGTDYIGDEMQVILEEPVAD